MKVYSVSPAEGSIEGEAFFTTKAAAFKCAIGIAKSGTEATVTVETIPPGRSRDLIVALLNRTGYSIDSDVVKVFPAEPVTIE